MFTLSIYLQQVAGYSAFLAGLALMPTTIVMFLLSPRFGSLAGRFGPRFFMAVGPIVGASGFLTMLGTSATTSYWTHLLPGVTLFAIGLSCTVSPLTSAVLGTINPEHAGVASAVNNAISRIAGLLTIATVGLITGPHLDTTGLHKVLVTTAILLAAGGIISAIGIQNHTAAAEPS
jgi:MFS family permease